MKEETIDKYYEEENIELQKCILQYNILIRTIWISIYVLCNWDDKQKRIVFQLEILSYQEMKY